MILLWQQGEYAAFDCLYQRYFVKLVNLAYKKTGNYEASQELAQDVFVSLHQQLHKLHARESLDGYLFISLRNKIFNYNRQLLARWRKQQFYKNKISIATNEVSEQLEKKELEEKLNIKIQELPAQCRKVFLLSRVEQLSHKEIAGRLNISTNTVEQHIRKAIRLLRDSVTTDIMMLLLFSILLHFYSR